MRSDQLCVTQYPSDPNNEGISPQSSNSDVGAKKHTTQFRQTTQEKNLEKEEKCKSMPFGAAWAYYGKVLVLASAALWNGCIHGLVK